MIRLATRIVICVAAVALIDTSALLPQPSDGALVVLGAGASGNWFTEYVLTNSESFPATTVITGGTPDYQTVCPPLVGCPDQEFVAIPARGTLTVAGPRLGFPVFFLRSIQGAVPMVRARIYNVTEPLQGADLPVFRVATLQALDPSSLVFPIRPTAARANLLLINLRDTGQAGGDRVTLGVYAYASTGELLGSSDLTLEFGQSLYLVDLARYLGIGNLAGGHIRVDRLAGRGTFWGLLPSVDADGGIAVSIGYVP